MICLLRVGFDGAEEPDEELLSPVADRLGNYKIERRDDGTLWELGRGAMGVTYRAVDTSLQRPVALKLIDSEWVKRGAEARERFMREARTAAALRHPNVATVHHFGIREETGQCFCAIELIEGETLETRVRRTGPLDALTTIEIALQVSSALAAAEKQGLVHRDLKPANLMFVAPVSDTKGSKHGKTDELIVKVIDFGVAKVFSEKQNAMELTHGGFVGTPAFASPEQFTNAPVDVRSDIYSLGATLWYLLTGRMPFAGDSVEQIRASQRSRTLPIEELKTAHVPNRLVALLVSMLATEPAARPGVRTLTSKLQECRAQILDRWKAARQVALVATLIGIATFALFPRWQNRAVSRNAAPANISDKSIAVLPFDNLSDQANAYFAVGIQDEILTSLTRVAELKVISRTSIMQYKAGLGRNLREIGKELGVAHLLEGSVQRDAKRVRVNAQLIDARTDAHLWAQTYDRDLADVFAIQSEIAKAIADQLHAKLSPSEKIGLEQPPTADLVAFDLYSRARSLLLSSAFGSPDFTQAVDLLNQAVGRDPSVFLAYCQLAQAHSKVYANWEHTPARLALLEAAVQAAFRLRPDAGEAHLARAEMLYRGYLDYDGALAEVEIARRTLPNSPEVAALTGVVLVRRGNREEALQHLQRALELDPRNTHILQQVVFFLYDSRRYAEVAATLDRILAINPDDFPSQAVRALVELDWKADPRPLHEAINSISRRYPSALREVAGFWLTCALAERDAGAAELALAALGDSRLGGGVMLFPCSFAEGLLARMTNDPARAHAAFTAARAEQEKTVEAQPEYGPALCVLGVIDAGLGRKDEAFQEGERAMELLSVEKDFSVGSHLIEYFAIIAAWVGEKELACEHLEKVTRTSGLNGVRTYGRLKLLPYWDPLRGDPRFEKIVASLAPKEATNNAGTGN